MEKIFQAAGEVVGHILHPMTLRRISELFSCEYETYHMFHAKMIKLGYTDAQIKQVASTIGNRLYLGLNANYYTGAEIQEVLNNTFGEIRTKIQEELTMAGLGILKVELIAAEPQNLAKLAAEAIRRVFSCNTGLVEEIIVQFETPGSPINDTFIRLMNGDYFIKGFAECVADTLKGCYPHMRVIESQYLVEELKDGGPFFGKLNTVLHNYVVGDNGRDMEIVEIIMSALIKAIQQNPLRSTIEHIARSIREGSIYKSLRSNLDNL